MKLFRILFASLLLAVSLSRAERPNIVIMLADDAGYSDFGCFGGKAKTPNIDQLASDGLRLTDFHAAAPNCSPSRTGLMTGRYPSRVGMYSYMPELKEGLHPMHMPGSEVTLAELLKAEGYQTGHVGKWHLSKLNSIHPQPIDQGFDYSFGTSNNAIPSHLNPINFVRNGKALGKVEGYSCQIVVDEAIQWMEAADKEDPFFLYVAFHEPHAKIASPPELVAQYHEENASRNNYLANIHNLDIAAGRLLEALDEQGHRENTIVVFASDNGSLHDDSNGGFRGQKSMLYEGGIREPGVIRWPAKIEAGQTSDATLNFVDLLPTLCSITGTDPPLDRTLDGVDFSPLLFGEDWRRDQPLYWFFYRSIAGSGQRAQGMTAKMPAGAFRKGDWLLIGYLEHENMPTSHAMVPSDMDFIREATWERFELYNLRSDRAQTRDVAKQNPELLTRLSREMETLHTSMVAEAPYWKWED